MSRSATRAGRPGALLPRPPWSDRKRGVVAGLVVSALIAVPLLLALLSAMFEFTGETFENVYDPDPVRGTYWLAFSVLLALVPVGAGLAAARTRGHLGRRLLAVNGVLLLAVRIVIKG